MKFICITGCAALLTVSASALPQAVDPNILRTGIVGPVSSLPPSFGVWRNMRSLTLVSSTVEELANRSKEEGSSCRLKNAAKLRKSTLTAT